MAEQETMRNEDQIISSWSLTADDILVSVICFSYNHEEYIEDAIKGFLEQETDFPIEMIIHDDASTDRSQELILAYKKKYPSLIKVKLQSENQYSNNALKALSMLEYMLSRAEGRYIAFLEGDDYWISAKKLQAQVDYMSHNLDCSLTFHKVNYQDGERLLGHYYEEPPSNCLTQKQVILNHYIPTSAMVCRAAMLKDGIGSCTGFYDFPVGYIPITLVSSGKGYVYYFKSIYGVLRKNPTRLTHDVGHLRTMRKKFIIMYYSFLSSVKQENRIFVVYLIVRLILGYLKFWKKYDRE